MKRKIRKCLLWAVKLAIAAGLLLYVISNVHWRDYAVTLEGEERPVAEVRAEAGRPAQLLVKEPSGQWTWRDITDFRPISFQLPSDRTAIVLNAQGDWRNPTAYEVQTPDGRRRWMAPAEFKAFSAQYVARGFRNTVASAKPYLLLAAFLLLAVPVLVTSLRWWYLLRIQLINVPLWECVKLCFLGQFFSFIVPGTVSGDLVKAWYVARKTQRKGAVLVSVFVDRVVGLFEFAMLPVLVMLVMAAGNLGELSRFRTPAIMVAAVLLVVVVSMALLLSHELRRLLRLNKIIARLPLQRHLAIVGEAARQYRRQWGALLRALGMTFGSQVFFITAIYLAGRSLDLPVPAYQYFLYVPLIYIVAAVPISPGGLGVAETFYVTFFSPSGGDAWQVSATQILALALIARLMPMIWSLPGLFVALRGPKLPDVDQMEAELEQQTPVAEQDTV